MDEPPEDPDDWTEEQWLAYLNDDVDGSVQDRRQFAPRLKNSAGATVLGAAMNGLFMAIYGEKPKPEVTIEAEAKGRDDGMKIDLDPADPAASTVTLPAHPHATAPATGEHPATPAT